MKVNKWTLGLAAVGLVSLPSITQAEEKMSTLMTQLSSTTISGYVNTDMTWKPGTGNVGGIPGRAFDAPASKQDGFNLNVVSLKIAKPMDEAQWASGYTAQLWFGPDAAGFNTSSPNLAGAGGDMAVKQAYIEFRAPLGNGLNFKIGHFNYIGGYEQPDAGDNPNFSRSYAWTLEPASHTGLLASYTASPWLTLAAGVANTYNNGVNFRAARLDATTGVANPAAESEKTYMASVALTAPESFGFAKGATLGASVVNGLNNASGDFGSVASVKRQTILQINVTSPTPLKALSVGASYDYLANPALAFAAPPVNGSGYVNAVTLYGAVTITEKAKFYARGEYTWGSQDFWYGGGTAKNQRLLGLTGTFDYSLWANVMSRLEVRWDHSANGDTPFPSGSGPGTFKNAVTLAMNMIYKF